MTKVGVKAWMVLLATILFSACGVLDGDTGFSLKISDAAPVDAAKKIVIKFTSVELHKTDGNVFSYDLTQDAIDLLSLPGSVSSYLLEDVQVDAGEYQSIVLKVDLDSSYIEFATDTTLNTRSEFSGLSEDISSWELSGPIEIDAGETRSFTIDVDLRRSIFTNEEGTEFILEPSLRIVDDTEAGHIRGKVNQAFLAQTDCVDKGVVYAFSQDSIPSDISPQQGPISSAKVGIGSLYETYEIGFLPIGDYIVAHTCDAGLDDPQTSGDTVVFNETINVSIQSGNEVVSANFEQ